MTAGQTERLLRVVDDRLDIASAELDSRGEAAGSPIEDLRWVAEKLDELARHRVDDFDRRSSALRDAEFRLGMKRHEIARSDETRAARERDLRQRIAEAEQRAAVARAANEQAAQSRLAEIELATVEASAALDAERKRLAVARERAADASVSLDIKERSRAMVDELAERQQSQLANFDQQLASHRADAEAVIAKSRLGLQTERQRAAAAVDALAEELRVTADAMDSTWTVRIKGRDHLPRLRELEEVARALGVTLHQA